MATKRRFSSIIAGAALLAAGPALAQFSDSYNFLKAVRDADGGEAQKYLNKPGEPALNSRDPANGETALHIVVRRHDQTWLGVLLAHGAQTEIHNRDGDTPLLVAAKLSDPDSTRQLLQYGARVNATDTGGETPLILAVQHRDMATARVLLANGADPRQADTIAGKSARDYAAEDSRAVALLKLIDETKPKVGGAISGPVRH